MAKKKREPDDPLDARRQKALAALLTYKTVAEAAAAAGCSERAMHNWLKEPGFLSEYRQALAQIVEHAIAQLKKLVGKAIDTLDRNLECQNPAAENTAAKTILEQAIKAVEIHSLLAELDTFKARLAELTRGA